MTSLISVLDLVLEDVVSICTVVLEMFGIVVLVVVAVKCFVDWVRRSPVNIRLNLAQGIALALEFKMGGEVLRTVVVREWSELGILGAIIVLSGTRRRNSRRNGSCRKQKKCSPERSSHGKHTYPVPGGDKGTENRGVSVMTLDEINEEIGKVRK